MRRLKAQSIGEYSICVAVIILSLITIQYYLKRGLQGRYADVVDHTTAQISTYSQYEPYYLDEEHTISQVKNIQLNIQTKGRQRSDVVQDQTTRSGKSIKGINCYGD